jgi:uncharacterized protein (TIGR02147 family)
MRIFLILGVLICKHFVYNKDMSNAGNNLQTDIYTYLDYRHFLADLTKELKKLKLYSVRQFAFEADIRTPGYMKMIIDGKRNLTQKMIPGFCRALKIKAEKKTYFEKLVYYNHCKDPDEKKLAFERLMDLRPHKEVYKLEEKQHRYFSNPYYACIQEMVALNDFKEDYEWIADRCFPQIRASQAKEAVESLLDLGLLTRNNSGKLRQTQNIIQTERLDTKIAETYNFHDAAINLARQALGRTKQDERNYLALMFPVSKSLYSKIIQETYKFHDHIIGLIENDEAEADEVHQMNIQLFPVTKKRGEK